MTPIAIGGNVVFTGAADNTHDLNLGTGAVALSVTPTITVSGAGSTLTFGGVVSGAGKGITKDGAGALVLRAQSTFNGDINVINGTLTAAGVASPATGLTGPLGNTGAGGRTFTIGAGATMEWDINNVLGGTGNSVANMPTIVLNGGTLNATRYSAIGNVTLNGGTLSQSSTEGTPANFDGYQFRGTITVTGTSASTISSPNGRTNHLGTNTNFNVADVTGDANADHWWFRRFCAISRMGFRPRGPVRSRRTAAGTMAADCGQCVHRSDDGCRRDAGAW